MKIFKKIFTIMILFSLLTHADFKENIELIHGGGSDNSTINRYDWVALGKVFSVTTRKYNGNNYLYTNNKEKNGGAYQAFPTEVGKQYRVKAQLIGPDVNSNEEFYTKSASYITIDDSIPTVSKKSNFSSKKVRGHKEVNIEFYFTATSSASYISYRSTEAWQYASARGISVKEINDNDYIENKQDVDKSVVPLIIDTDMLTDCDDAAALGVAHALEDNGEAKILAVTLSGHDYSKESQHNNSITVSAINYYYNQNFDIPIGAWHQLVENGGLSSSMQEKFRFSASPDIHSEVKENHTHDNILNYERESSLDIYRRVLNDARDNSVKIVIIGASFNVARLLKEERELVRQKVKEIIFSAPYGSCNQNMCVNNGLSRSEGKKSTDYIFDNLPSNVILTISGSEDQNNYEKGEYYDAGKEYKGTGSPMETAYENAYDAINIGRSIFDHMAVLAAVREDKRDEYWDIDRDGYFVSKFSSDEKAYWIHSKPKNHIRLRFNKSKIKKLLKEVNSLMLQKPQY